MHHQQIGVGILALCDVIAGGASAICAAATTVITALMQALVASVPQIVEGVFVLLDSVLATLVEYTPKVVQAAFDLLMAVLNGIASNLSQVVQAAVDVVLAFVDGIVKSVNKVVDAGMKMIIDFINGLAESIRTNTPLMIDAVNNLMEAVIEAIVAWFENFATKGFELIGELGTGILNAAGDAAGSVGDVISGMITAVTDTVSDWTSAAGDLIDGLIKGIKDGVKHAVVAAQDLASDVWNSVCDFLGIKSPSRKFIEIGKYSDQGLAVGLSKYTGVVTSAAKDVGSDAVSTLSKSLSGISKIITDDIDSNPTIRPVLDLTDVKSGVGSIDSMLLGRRSLQIAAGSAGAISASMGGYQNGGSGDIVSAIEKLGKNLGNTSGDTYTISGITYDDGTNISNAVKSLVRAARIERRV